MSNFETWPVKINMLRVRHAECGQEVRLTHDDQRKIYAYCPHCTRHVRTKWTKHWVQKGDGSYGYEDTPSLAPEVNLSAED